MALTATVQLPLLCTNLLARDVSVSQSQSCFFDFSFSSVLVLCRFRVTCYCTVWYLADSVCLSDVFTCVAMTTVPIVLHFDPPAQCCSVAQSRSNTSQPETVGWAAGSEGRPMEMARSNTYHRPVENQTAPKHHIELQRYSREKLVCDKNASWVSNKRLMINWVSKHLLEFTVVAVVVLYSGYTALCQITLTLVFELPLSGTVPFIALVLVPPNSPLVHNSDYIVYNYVNANYILWWR